MNLTNVQRRNKMGEYLGKGFLWLCAIITLLSLFIVLGYVMQRGLAHVSWEFISEMPAKRGREGGIFSIVVNTLHLMFLSVAIATPIAVGTAIYLTEYTRENFLTRIIRFGTEALAGIPSIIFGLFGFAFFVLYSGLGWSLLSGALTLALMILPIMIRSTEESLKTVPRAYREGSLALGATLWQTVYKVVLPSAIPGIVTGIILGMGRAVGETAVVLLTTGSALRIAESMFDQGRVLSLHLFMMAMEGVAIDKAYATAVILIFFILIINTITNVVLKRFVNKVS